MSSLLVDLLLQLLVVGDSRPSPSALLLDLARQHADRRGRRLGLGALSCWPSAALGVAHGVVPFSGLMRVSVPQCRDACVTALVACLKGCVRSPIYLARLALISDGLRAQAQDVHRSGVERRALGGAQGRVRSLERRGLARRQAARGGALDAARGGRRHLRGAACCSRELDALPALLSSRRCCCSPPRSGRSIPPC